MMNRDDLKRVAEKIDQADALIFGAGAGMGVDSGLPDFRGKEGFWRAYPVFKDLGYRFEEMANPEWFGRDPRQAWGFYGHRLNTYRDTNPHDGFRILNDWMLKKHHGGFVFTSNVDGHFQKAGFSEDSVYECHGSINWLQSSQDTSGHIWSADSFEIDVDSRCRAIGDLPYCEQTGVVARPNILMFGDWMWNSHRSDDQQRRFEVFLQSLIHKDVVVIELGAGKSVPTVRINCERMASQLDGTLVRINPYDSEAPEGAYSFAAGALECLQEIDQFLHGSDI